jgi:hypothetical protein
LLTEEEADADCKSEDWCSEQKTAEECELACHSLTGYKIKVKFLNVENLNFSKFTSKCLKTDARKN